MSTGTTGQRDARGVHLFFALACVSTWLLDTPLALAFIRREEPPPYAVALAGLSAWAPTLAAFVIAARRRELREVFGRWRTNPVWIVLALGLTIAIHVPATALDVALGGDPAQWVYWPVKPEHFAAMIMFGIGEEFGWRGFAYPRVVDRYGPILGCLLLGLVWGIWHTMMCFSPEDGSFDLLSWGCMMLELPLAAIVWAWFFEKGNRSMAVAIALHFSAHLNRYHDAPDDEIRIRVFRFLVYLIAAVLAGRALIAMHEMRKSERA